MNDHLDRRRRWDLAGDLEANYADDVLVLSKDGAYRGKDGIRHTARLLEHYLPGAAFSYDLVRLQDEVTLLSWSAKARDGSRTRFGADTFIIKGGRIAVQTIHYEVR